MLKMRLQRIGRRNSPAYRVLVVDSRQGPKSGKFIDQIGAYDPRTGSVSIDVEKAKTWVEKGVQLSDTVHNMLIDQKVIEGKKVNVLPKKSPIVSEQPEEEAAPAPSEGEQQEESDTPEAPEQAEEVADNTEAEQQGEEAPEGDGEQKKAAEAPAS